MIILHTFKVTANASCRERASGASFAVGVVLKAQAAASSEYLITSPILWNYIYDASSDYVQVSALLVTGQGHTAVGFVDLYR